MATSSKEKTKKKNRYPGVYQRGDKWAFHAEGPRQPNGKRKQVTKSGYPTQKAAWEAKVALLDQLNKGLYTEPSKMTLRELLDYWLEKVIKMDASYTTYIHYTSICKRACEELGHIKGDKLRETHFQDYFVKMLEQGLARTTVRQHYMTLRMALKKLTKLKLLKSNVLLDVDPPKVKRKEQRYMTPEEVEIFLEAIKNSKAPYYYDVFLFAVATGVRIGEALAVKWNDFDQEQQIIEISRSWKRGESGLVEGSTKNNKSRSFTYGEVVKEILAQRRSKQRKERLLAGPAFKDTGYLFTDALGKPYNIHSVGAFASRVATRLGLQDVTFHTLRHTNASILLLNNVNLLKIQAILGHSTLDMTAHYAHVSKHDTAAANTMDNALSIVTHKRLG